MDLDHRPSAMFELYGDPFDPYYGKRGFGVMDPGGVYPGAAGPGFVPPMMGMAAAWSPTPAYAAPPPPPLGGIYYDASIPERFLMLEKLLCDRLRSLQFNPPVSCVYNPLEYAFETHSYYVRKYCNSTKDILFVGMNPGPFGMAQTGVPFGEVTFVKDWLKIEGNVYKPAREHPHRPIFGFNCTRNEVSGQRFWGFFKDLCQTPDNFFRYTFVHNYCPLVFMAESGKNITPPELKAANRRPVYEICDAAFCDVVRLLQAKIIIAIGRFAHDRVKVALQSQGLHGVRLEYIMHPSPINPVANKGWKDLALKNLSDMNLLCYFTPT